MGELKQGEFGSAVPQLPPQEVFTLDELRLLQSMLQTDRKTLDYIEGVVAGTDLTERRAGASILAMKIRRMLDREISADMQARQAEAKRAAEEAGKRQAEEAERARQLAEAPPSAPEIVGS